MHLSQIKDENGDIRTVVRRGEEARLLASDHSVYDLALECAQEKTSIAEQVERIGLGSSVDLAEIYRQGRLLAPINHPDPAHLFLTGTGLTHLGSAATRDAMHRSLEAEDETALTDSMKMFRMGLEGGKPEAGAVGVQPEWFYKGNGHQVAAPGEPLTSPSFAQDGGEEPEVAGIYVVDQDGRPCRVGFSLANEFSDHVMERVNYLYLAHSKLRPASVGPEILVGPLPAHVAGTSRILRGGRTIWEKPFLSGEGNMSHSIANLEHHHFKYGLFRQPGDVHVHMFGTATLSFADGIQALAGDIFEIEAPEFGLPLRNPLAITEAEDVTVRPL